MFFVSDIVEEKAFDVARRVPEQRVKRIAELRTRVRSAAFSAVFAILLLSVFVSFIAVRKEPSPWLWAFLVAIQVCVSIRDFRRMLRWQEEIAVLRVLDIFGEQSRAKDETPTR